MNDKLSQLSDIFKLIQTQSKNDRVDYDDYTEQLWLAEVDERIFSFKHKIQNYLKERTKEK